MSTLTEDQTTAILYATSQRIQHNGHTEQTYDPDKYEAFLAGCRHRDNKAGAVLESVTAELRAYKLECERIMTLLQAQAKLLEQSELDKTELRKRLALAAATLEEIYNINPFNQGDVMHAYGLAAQALNQIRGT